MTRTERIQLKWAVTLGSLLWMVLVALVMVVTLPDNVVENHGSEAVQIRMSDCTGTFQDRYDCKEQIINSSGRHTFLILTSRFLLVIVPPLLATGWLSSRLRKYPVELEQPHHHTEKGDWKARAQMHTENQSPTEAARELHLTQDELPHLSHKGHHLIDDIAPIEDWTAHGHGHGPKRGG